MFLNLKLCFPVFIVIALTFGKKPETFRQANNPIKNALFLGNTSISNNTREDCVWRRGNEKDFCPDPDVRYILYTSAEPTVKRALNISQADWLRNSGWDPNHENIILIHGYAGGDDTLPIIVLRDAYLRNGNYNVFMVDWGKLTEPPCYPSAVHNLRPVARCLADVVTYLRHNGMDMERTTCVGHSLGAHMCGIMANYLLFRLHRIIGLDPARPLIKSGLNNRLDSGDALNVQVIHTNAGHYGEMGRVGSIDFCVNGGRMQPFCEATNNEPLCSHVWVVCYMAESINKNNVRMAEPCSRRCPYGPRPGNRFGHPVPMGQHTPLMASGSYCLSNDFAPYCPRHPGDSGDKRCCIKEEQLETTDRNINKRPLHHFG